MNINPHPQPNTASALLAIGANLEYVAQRFQSGHLPESEANAYFKVWCLNKWSARWNQEHNRPEVCAFGRNTESWSEFFWSSYRP